MISTILSYLLVGLMVVLGVSVALAIVGVVFGLALGLAKFLLFTVGPLLLVGYVVTRLFSSRRTRLTKAEREWLEG